jgi:hypothetical protein
MENDFFDIFGGIDISLLFLIILSPAFLGLLAFLTEQDMNVFYHVSHYLGLLFFQPEINF